MAKRYTGIQIDFAHLAANSPPNLYLPVAPGEHWDTTDSKFKIQKRKSQSKIKDSGAEFPS
jgi:hypothetical protein